MIDLYGEGFGQNFWNGERCERCDSRYCAMGCKAGGAGYVYAVGYGWVTFQQAKDIEASWEAQGFEYGIDAGKYRVEWDNATPAIMGGVDVIRITALQRDKALGKISVYEEVSS